MSLPADRESVTDYRPLHLVEGSGLEQSGRPYPGFSPQTARKLCILNFFYELAAYPTGPTKTSRAKKTTGPADHSRPGADPSEWRPAAREQDSAGPAPLTLVPPLAN